MSNLDVIGLPEVAQILGKSRQWVWLIYKEGKLQAVTLTGTPQRPRPLFNRAEIEKLRDEVASR